MSDSELMDCDQNTSSSDEDDEEDLSIESALTVVEVSVG